MMYPLTGEDLIEGLMLAYKPPRPPAISEELRQATIITAFSSMVRGQIFVSGKALFDGIVKDFNFNF